MLLWSTVAPTPVQLPGSKTAIFCGSAVGWVAVIMKLRLHGKSSPSISRRHGYVHVSDKLAADLPAVGGCRPSPSQAATGQPMAVAGHIVKPANGVSTRSQMSTRVQYQGARFQCSVASFPALKQALADLYASKGHWTPAGWKAAAAKLVKARDFGAQSWGGVRCLKNQKQQPEKPKPAAHQDKGVEESPAVISATLPPVEYHPPAAPAPKTPEAALPIAPPADGGGPAAGVPLPLANGSMDPLPYAFSESKHSLPKLKGYQILEYLGGGTFGEVYKAKMRDTGTIVAVKVQRKGGNIAQKSTEQARELTLMKGLAHPYVVYLLGWRETHFNLQLIMVYYEQDLHKYIRQQGQQGVAVHEAKIIAGCLVSALTYIHGKQIIHRDLKPANMLVQRQPMAALIADFGAGRTLLPSLVSGGAGERLSEGVCTRWYAAPEVLLSSTYSFPSDVWSLGIVIAEVESGRAPFRNLSSVGMMFQILRALGTPPMKEIDASCDSQAWKGQCGTFLFPQFSAPQATSWGFRYGPEFKQYVGRMLQLLPGGRERAMDILQCSQWHICMGLALGAQGVQAKGVAVFQNPLGPLSRWRDGITGSFDQEVLVTLAVLCVCTAFICSLCTCFCLGYKIGGYNVSALQTSDNVLKSFFLSKSGKKVHFYKTCQTLEVANAVRMPGVIELEACSYCTKRQAVELCVGKGA